MKRKNSNLNFIANYLWENPYSSSTEIRKALCKHTGSVYTRGTYCEYFRTHTNSQWHCSTLPSPRGRFGPIFKLGYGSVLWKRIYIDGKPKWFLTLKGIEYVTKYKIKS